MSGRRAIVTLAIGEDFQRRWRELVEPNWRAYAERHGYELVCLTEPLDDSARARARSPSWQKLLVLSQPFAREFERIVWVDSDILFSRDAPDVAEGVPLEKVGAVDEFDQPTADQRKTMYGDIIDDYYAAAGLDQEFHQVTQGGLFVLSPEHHEEVFLRAYDHEDIDLNYEMRFVSYELLKADLVHWVDPRFNVLSEAYKLLRYRYLVQHPLHPRAREAMDRALGEVWGLHFAGKGEEIDLLFGEQPPPPASAAAPGKRPASAGPVRTPVLIFAFARPDTTRRLLDAVRAVRPRRLLVVADAPRPDVPGEAELCEQTRAVFDEVDWDCELLTDFATERTTLKRRIESGFDWAFEQTEELIAFEDDTIPDPSFFPFCDELLERYRDDERVISVGGNNFQFAGPTSDDSYYFSRYPPGPGFATWRRAWSRHDPLMSEWPALRDSGWLEGIIKGANARGYWAHSFEQRYRLQDHWDGAWLFTGWVSGGLHIVPNVNLISNVGYREDATNTGLGQRGLFGDLPTVPIGFPLSHPAAVEVDERADTFKEMTMYSGVITDLFKRVRMLKRGVGVER